MRQLSWRLGWLLAAIVASLVAVGGYALTRPTSAAPVANQPAVPKARHSVASGAQARHPGPARSYPVGALFDWHGGHGEHFCTASVVSSPGGDLIVTAAHCVTGRSLSAIVFAPGYARGRFPRGLWAVRRKFVDASWAARQDPDDDFAFLEVDRLTGKHVPAVSSAGTVQRAAGAEHIRFNAALPAPIRAIGYPDGGGGTVACSTKAVAFRPGSLNQVMFVCPGFTDGTSGGPFLSEFSRTRDAGAIIGVIGGYQQGGDSPSISYSAAFTSATRSLYERAERASR